MSNERRAFLDRWRDRTARNRGRFREYLPLARELAQHEKGSPEWFAVVERASDVRALQATVREVADLQMADATFLEAMAASRTAGG